MSIEQRNELEALKRRVMQLEMALAEIEAKLRAPRRGRPPKQDKNAQAH